MRGGDERRGGRGEEERRGGEDREERSWNLDINSVVMYYDTKYVECSREQTKCSTFPSH